MIKQEDIRIGNYFLGFDNKPFKWELEHFTMVGSSSIDFDEIIKEPIPLTEEWLLKLGFEKLTDRIKGFTATTYSKKGYYFDDTTNGCWRLTISNINIKNVHQLQNVFYALTGEELKLSL